MKYRILIASNWEELQHDVNEKLAEGWILQGGVSTTSHSFHNARDDYWDTTYEYAQAMLESDGSPVGKSEKP